MVNFFIKAVRWNPRQFRFPPHLRHFAFDATRPLKGVTQFRTFKVQLQFFFNLIEKKYFLFLNYSLCSLKRRVKICNNRVCCFTVIDGDTEKEHLAPSYSVSYFDLREKTTRSKPEVDEVLLIAWIFLNQIESCQRHTYFKIKSN